MNETKSTVKTILAFVLALVLIAGVLFGIDLPYDEVDLGNMITEETTANETPVTGEQTEPSVITTDAPAISETPDDSANEPQDSTPTDTETEVVDNSADETVADTTENNQVATEGEVENA